MSRAPVQSVPLRRRSGLTVTALVGLALLLAGATLLWQRHARTARVLAALPELPATQANATLRDLLEQARRDAATGNLAAVARLGRLCHANGLPAAAEACWRILIREQPREGRWHYYLADVLRATGDQTAAEEQLQLTVAADPTAATAWLQLAEMKFKSGRQDAAEGDYQRRLALLPGDPYAELGLARLAQLRGRSDETLARLESLLQEHPKFSAAQNLYAELQAAAGHEDLADLHRWLGRDAGRFREADDPWMDELNADCHDSKRLCHLGTIAYQTGHGDLGRAQFQQAIALAPGDPLGYQLLGQLRLEQGAAAEARDLLRTGLARATDAPPAPAHYLKLSEACLALQQPDEAGRALADGLARFPDSAELHHAAGNLLARQNDAAGAEAAYRRALALNPALVEADFSLAVLLLNASRPAEAREILANALQMQPTFPKALLLLGRLEIDAGRVESAGQYLLPLLKANPGAPEIRQIVGRWHQQAGQLAEKTDPAATERHYRAGLALLPDDAELNAGLGVRLLLAGRIEEAVAPLEAFHRLKPEAAQAALFLGQAYARTGRMADARRVLAAGLQQAEQSGRAETARNFREILSVLPP